ncbi:hypothetical protein B0A48_10095 [Cryoendolithus antarcticus]|uniref:Uncharacterized protein n=1 Tax=Cryoendolithus antarcticus TaxID=1507870 RepID=A0A1V8SX11_9PEZI|nr:hypothetical protein B0A48_10095 [Cryoendolithus antarcticus]
MFNIIETIDLSNDDNMSIPTVKHFTGLGLDGTTAGRVTLTTHGSKSSISLTGLHARHAAPSTFLSIAFFETWLLTMPAPLTLVITTETHDASSKKRKTHDDGKETARKSAKTATVESAGRFKLPSSIDQIRKIISDSDMSLSDKSSKQNKAHHVKSGVSRKASGIRGETHNELASPPFSAVKATTVKSPLFCTPPPPPSAPVPPSSPAPPSTPPPTRGAQRNYKKILAELQNAPKKAPPRYQRSAYVEALRRARDDTDDDEELTGLKSENQTASTTGHHGAARLASLELLTATTTGIYGILGPKKDSQKVTPALLSQAHGRQATQQTAHTAQQTVQLQQTVQDLLNNLTHISQVPAIIAAQQQVFNHQLAAQQQTFDHQYLDMESFNAELHRRLLEVERDNSRFKNGTFPNEKFEVRVAGVEQDQVDVKKAFDEQCRTYVGGTNRAFMERDVKMKKLEEGLDRVIGEFEELERMEKKKS